MARPQRIRDLTLGVGRRCLGWMCPRPAAPDSGDGGLGHPGVHCLTIGIGNGYRVEMHSPDPYEPQLFALLEGLPLGVYVFRLEDPSRKESLRIVYANRASEEMLGLDPSSVVGGLIGEHFPNILDEGGLAAGYRDAIVSQTPCRLGVVSYGDVRVPVQQFDVSGYPVGPDMLVLLFDNLSSTPRRVTELAAIVESAEDAILSKSLDGTILTWNASAERIYGYGAEEAIGSPIAMLLPPDRPLEVEQIINRLRTGERLSQFETKRVRKDGRVIDVSLTVSPIRDVSGTIAGAATIARDIGTQKKEEARLQLLAAIVDAAEDAILSRTLEGVVTSWNAGAERLFGYTAHEMLGRSTDILLGDVSPEQLAQRVRLVQSLRPATLVTSARRKDGSLVPVSAATAPIMDASGVVTGVAVILHDISEQRQLEQRLRQSEKLEAIGSLAGGVAHDFNNILTVIRAAATIALADNSVPADGPVLRKLRQIDEAAEHAATLTRQLLAFGRQQVLRPQATDLNMVVGATLDLAERLIGEGVEVVRRLAPDLCPVLVDRNQLEQVILNLCVNARDAMSDGGTLSIHTMKAVLPESYASDRAEVTPGSYSVLEVTDSGTGMDEQTRNRIFDPFFTTKATGTGLGLATVLGIVKQSDGHIEVYSEVGVGTTFKIYLPYADQPVALETMEPSDAVLIDGTETILLVEDNEMLRPVVIEVLESYGYTVYSARDATEAMAIADEHTTNIDLLLTDVVMPGLDGGELAAILSESYPLLKVVFTSGYPAGTVVQTGIADASISFIQKPFLADELARKVRATLDGGDRTA
jgi:two-component system cell cycle sensor histidine kinase/response regulator CckA